MGVVAHQAGQRLAVTVRELPPPTATSRAHIQLRAALTAPIRRPLPA
ncbi:MAG: hypothetical protein WBV74_13710 [Pseudonocardiaceae bacterium]